MNCILAALLISNQSDRVRIALHCWTDLSLARIRANQNTRYDPGALSWAALLSSDQSGRVRIALHCWIDLSLARIRANQNTRYDPGALSWAALVSSDQSGRVRIALHCWIDPSLARIRANQNTRYDPGHRSDLQWAEIRSVFNRGLIIEELPWDNLQQLVMCSNICFSWNICNDRWCKNVLFL